MSQEFVLTRDIVYDHNERMLNIRKYYPYFKLVDSAFNQFKDGKYTDLDMGYILMAVIRFFIEENNFNERNVSFQELKDFLAELLRRDFDLHLENEEEGELIGYIFDKIKNDGKPFVYEYFDPQTKKKQAVRMKLIEDQLKDDMVTYTITSDAIEFYLDTKEIKDENTITTSQLLLTKMIASKNFKGGTEVVKRINHEVSRLIARKNEVLNLLSVDVYGGIQAFEEFQNTGIRWFEEEQKLFHKNRELIEKTLRQGEADGKYHDAMADIYVLETQLNQAMTRHSELLLACTQLQVRADEILQASKFSKLRSAFDYKTALSTVMERDDSSLLGILIAPLLPVHPRKWMPFEAVDDLLSCRVDKDEAGEKKKENLVEENYEYPDELEEKRIRHNYEIFLTVMLGLLQNKEEFSLEYMNEKLERDCFPEILKHGDYYSFLVHLCQKNYYDMTLVKEKTDTFLEGIMKEYLSEHPEYEAMKFELERTGEVDVLYTVQDFVISNLRFAICEGKENGDGE